MPLNWEAFGELPGAPTSNFERLCRTLIRWHFSQYGDFRALAQQPGVEFHLNLHTPCDLGTAGRWFGWQCRWYDLASGRPIGASRKQKVESAIVKTEQVVSDMTDWILWTRHALTKADQDWFYSINTKMRLALWTADDLEDLLTGQSEVLRSTYFGEFVLTPDLLCRQHSIAVASIRDRWVPELHQVLDAERQIERHLGTKTAWAEINQIAQQLETSVASVRHGMKGNSSNVRDTFTGALEVASGVRDRVRAVQAMLESGDLDLASEILINLYGYAKIFDTLIRKLRATRSPLALSVSNLIADIRHAVSACEELHECLTSRTLAVIGGGGYGKTQMAAQLTSGCEERAAGVFLHGSHLRAGDGLDQLVGRFVIAGKPLSSFEALAAALDAAGRRTGHRLPIFIDGLNEADDPRVWKSILASANEQLALYSHVLLIYSLRPDLSRIAIPEGTRCFELDGFRQSLNTAIDAYFKHYLIDPTDAAFTWKILDHPLMLKMFCEVTNPKRITTVGVEAMPTSLTALFDKYLGLVADRVYQLSPSSSPHLVPDVRAAISCIGLVLWYARARVIDKNDLRISLKDDHQPWHTSIVRALEYEGILIRHGREDTTGDVAILYDALAGHIIADALLENFGSQGWERWLQQETTSSAIGIDHEKRHPLATDILNALVGLHPRRKYRKQLWPLVKEPLRTLALRGATHLEGEQIDAETVNAITTMITNDPAMHTWIYDRLFVTRAARSHPLDSRYLDSLLRSMTVSDRDLSWTEWMRTNKDDIISDLESLTVRWEGESSCITSGHLHARWVMWTLTSTVRVLRDHATRALYSFGCNNPAALFELAIESLAVNDPYVPERMLAASYGVSMSLWADPRGDSVRTALPDMANNLVDRMFTPGAPYLSWHALMRDSALGIIALARQVHPDCIPEDKRCLLSPPFEYVPSPFVDAEEIGDEQIINAAEAIQMDFGNYTLGRLVPTRGNYDFKHSTYTSVRKEIEMRIVELGYSSSRYHKIDEQIRDAGWRAQRGESSRIDRYGKKYSWIAYYEMYGLRQSREQLDEWRTSNRPSDVDIDPSFPKDIERWTPELPDLFTGSPSDLREWLANGPTPSYKHLLDPENVGDQPGPWALLEGYIEQASSDDDRNLFTFLRGVLVNEDEVQALFDVFDARKYPGNYAIPEPAEDHYTYAGEIPWSRQFASGLRGADGRAQRDCRVAFERGGEQQSQSEIQIEVPVFRFSWESHHSQLNQASGAIVPAPALCEKLGLVNRRQSWDLYDSAGKVATLCRGFKNESDTFASRLAYIRSDLLSQYLTETGQTLVWILWGERGINYRAQSGMLDNQRDILAEYMHIHRYRRAWTPR